MPRLNHRAYQILCSEIQKCAGNDPLNQIEQKLVVQDLERLRSQPGSAASVEELRNLVIVTYPTFSEKALSAAAKANHSLGVWGQIRLAVLVFIGAAVVLVGTAGALGLAIILLSSTDSEPVASDASSSTNFTSMSSEEHFQEATLLVEQVEQSINKVTTPADLAVCEKKLNEAKNHVDELPVSYTVSSPVLSSRRSHRRVRRHYERQTIYNEQFASLSSQVEQLQAQITNLKAENTRASTLITAAKEFAFAAAKAVDTPRAKATRILGWATHLIVT